MLSSRLIPNCLTLNYRFKFVFESNIQKQHKFYKLGCQYVTNVSTAESEGFSSTKKCISTSDEGDDFGSLNNPLERSKTSKNFRVIKVKKKFRTSQSNEADVFGNLSSDKPMWYPDLQEDSKIDNDQDDDSTLVKNISKKYRCSADYLTRMKKLVTEKRLKEALELFVEMRRNFVTPLHAHFTFMIGACGRFGFTEMAFKLLKQMTDRNLQPTCATLTGLFNACGECPFPEFGLQKAHLLREKIQVKGWQLNQITYHAMIKAFGRCGDIETAFQVVNEMAKNEIRIDSYTYNVLLMSCISNKEVGFTHAVEVFRKMKEKKCIPNVFSFNLLLRATRDCGAGPEEVSSLLLQHWSNYPKRPYGFKTKSALPQKEILHLKSGESSESMNSVDFQNISREHLDATEECEHTHQRNKSMPNSLQEIKLETSLVNDMQNSQPSVINARPLHGTEILELGELNSPNDRLVLIGNAVGFLNNMKNVGVKPNIKTFTLLLECLPPNIESEEQLMSLLDEYKIKPDNGFFNVLIKRRHYRRDTAAAHEVLILMNKWNLTPDLITFGVLSLGCRNYQQYSTFINDMEKLGYCPNINIIGCLLTSACYEKDFLFLKSLLHLMNDLNIAPTQVMLTKIENTLEITRKNILDMEHGKSVSNVYRKKDLPKKYKEFCATYDQWLKKTDFGKEDHVWDQFRTNIVEKKLEKAYTPLRLD